MGVTTIKLNDSEHRVMDVLWDQGEMCAGDIAQHLGSQTGWSRSTVYTVLKWLHEKGAIERIGHKYLCRPLISRGDVQTNEAVSIVDRLFDGSASHFLSAYCGGKRLDSAEIQELKKLIEEME